MSSVTTQPQTKANTIPCFQEGFLPVPLRYVTPESLNGLKIYIHNPPVYNLYKNLDLSYGASDHLRLLDGGIETVYIPTADHQAYYHAVGGELDNILGNREVVKQKKSEILYATTLALANQVLSQPPGVEQINQVRQMTSSMVKYIFKDPRSFNHLFDISNHDFYTATHMTNVSTIMVAYANYLGIDDLDFLNDLGTGAMLHDIGKMFIPSDLLNCKDKLNVEQINLIQSHVQKGVDHLAEVNGLSDTIIQMVAEHHEKNDGTGYPRHLLCDDIHLVGKMTSLVDCYEAMVSIRPYRDHGLTRDEALDIIASMSPSSFDLDLVSSFTQFVRESMENVAASEASIELNQRIRQQLGFCRDNDNPSGRIYNRFYLRIRCTVNRMFHKNDQWTAGPDRTIIIHNISQGGVGVLSPKPIPVNSILRIKISSSNLKSQIVYLAKVVRIVHHPDGWHTLGLQFIKPQSSDHISDLYRTLK